MADNVTVDNGSGTDYTVSTDDAGASGHVQRVKLVVSADGSASHATVDADGVLVNLGANNDVTVTGSVTADTELPAAGALADNTANPTAPAVAAHGMVFDGSTWDRAPGTSADGALVNLGSNNDVTVTGAVTANAGTNLNTSALALESGGNLAAAATSLAIVDDWDESDRAKVNPIVGQAGVAAGAGSVDATVQRVTIADDDAILSVIALSMGYLVGLATSSTATAVSLASATSSAQLVAANSDRKGLTLTNTDANRVYVNFGATASATAFAFFLDEGDYWEMSPATRYLGAINAIWTGDGSGALIGQEFD